MDKTTRQSETTSTKTESHAAKNIVGVIFAVIEIILGFRLVFKLLGANPDNGFVKVIYNVTQFFVGIFEGIFGKVTDTGAVFEPATLIAMIIVALVAWLILMLVRPRKSSRTETTETTK